MTPKTKDIIEKCITYIEEEDFEKLYDEVNRELYDYEDVSDLTKTLLSAGIDPSSKLSKIPHHYMYHVDGVNYVKLPANIKELSDSAFSGMLDLKTLDLSACNKVGKIPDCLCMNSINLEEVKLPDSIYSIESYAFSDCHKLRKINLSNKIRELWGGCFQRCNSLTSVHIPCNSMIIFGAAVFAECINLKNVTFDSYSKLNILPSRAFKGCSSLEEIEVPEGIHRIQMLVFNGCTSLHTVHLPSTLEYIEVKAFNDCPNLRKFIYNGTSDEFMNIDIDRLNISLEVVCTDKTINI